MLNFGFLMREPIGRHIANRQPAPRSCVNPAGPVAYWMAAAGLITVAAVICRRLELAPALTLSGLFGMFILFPLTNYDYLAAVILAPFALSRPGAQERSDLLAYGGFVLLGNLIFLKAPSYVPGRFWGWIDYRTESALVCLVLCYFAVRWFRASNPVHVRGLSHTKATAAQV